MALALLALSIHCDDGFSLLATVLLAMISSFVGLGTRSSPFRAAPIPDRMQMVLPRNDVIIHYPNVSVLSLSQLLSHRHSFGGKGCT